MAKDIARVAARPWILDLPTGPLILLTDGLWLKSSGQRYTVYVLGVKVIGDDRVTFLPPVLCRGQECKGDWQRVLDALPDHIKTRIVAWIADGFVGVRVLARQYGWILQSCHAHVLRRLQIYRGRRQHRRFAGSNREALYQACVQLLRSSDDEAKRHEVFLHDQMKRQPPSKRFGYVIRHLLKTGNDLRAYQRYPELQLPTTTNVMESLNSQLRSRTTKHRTPASAFRWIQAYIKLKKYYLVHR